MPLRVLLVEDSEDDATLLLHHLRRGGFAPQWQRVDTADALQAALAAGPWDIACCDYVLPQLGGPAAIELIRAHDPDLPVIVVSGEVGEEVAVSAMRAGANDFVVKDRPARLLPAIARELQDARGRAARRHAEHELRAAVAHQAGLLAAVNDAVISVDAQLRTTVWNPKAEEVYGWRADEVLGRNSEVFLATDFVAHAPEDVLRLLAEHGRFRGEVTQRRKGGVRFPVELTVVALRDERGTIAGYVSVNRDISERKQAERELQLSQDRYRQLAEDINNVIFEVDTGGVITYISPAIRAVTGFEPAELLGRTFGEFVHPDEQAQRLAEFSETLAGDFRPGEFRVFDRAGGTRWVRTFSRPIVDNGNVLGLRGILSDITERKHAEAERVCSEARLKKIIAAEPECVKVLTAKGVLLEMNAAGLAMIEADSLAQVVGTSILHLVRPEHRDAFRALTRRVCGGDEGTLEFEIEGLKGTRRWLETHAVSLESEDNADVLLLGITRDITERKRAAEQLQRYAARLEILRMIDRGIVAARLPDEIAQAVVAPVQQLIGCDRVSIVLFDFTAGEATIVAAASAVATQLLPGVRFRQTALGERAVAALKEGHPFLMPDLRAMDEPVPMGDALAAEGLRSGAVVPLRSGGDLVGALNLWDARPNAFDAETVAAVEDVAGQLGIALRQSQLHEAVQRYAAQLEQRVHERTAELNAVNQELEAFSYSVSHDLRAPLRRIEGFSRILLEEHAERLNLDGQACLARLTAASTRMGQLIDDLLSLARVTRAQLQREPVDLSALAVGIAAELQRSQPERPVQWRIAPGLITDGDARLLRVALENLLENAWKYTRTHPAACIEIGGIERDGQSVFFVRDDGAGFDPRHADKLFAPFQRLHREADFEGTGIGLATVQRIVHRHGGRIWAEAAVEHGATFYFTLPPPAAAA